MRNSKLILILVSGFWLLVTGLTGCGRKTEEVHKQTAFPVSVAKVSRQDLKEFLFYSGDIQARDEATVYSKVTGKLAENKVQEEDVVKKGETLALVDRDEVGYEFALAPVTSPISGVVGRSYLDKGANVTLNTAIALVVNVDEVRVKIDVTEKDLPKVKKGLPAQVKVDAYPDEVFSGQIEKLSPVVDLGTRTAPVWIKIANAGHRLKPGMFARIRLLAGEHKNALAVVSDAVIREDSQRYVFVVEDNHAYKKKVELGLVSEGRVEVLEGLKLADKVIVMAAVDLKSGDSVRIVEEEK